MTLLQVLSRSAGSFILPSRLELTEQDRNAPIRGTSRGHLKEKKKKHSKVLHRLVTMATTDPIPSPPCPVSQDDGGLWMKMDFSPVMDHTEMTQGNLLPTSAEKPHEDTEVVSTASTGITRYCSVIGEGEDDVFIPPPPSCMPPSPPTGVSTGTADPGVNNSSVAVTNGAVGVTEAKANPKGLECHHGEKQLMAAQNKVDDVTESKGQVNRSKERVDTISLSEERDSTPSTEQDHTSMDSTSILTESNKGSEHIVMLSEDSNSTQENNAERDTYPKTEEITGKETDYDTPQTEEEMRANKKSTESVGEAEDIRCLAKDTYSTLTTETVDSNTVDTNTATLPGVNVSDSDFSPPQKKTCGPPELCKCNQSKIGIATYQPEVPKSPAEVSSDVDTRSLNYNVTKEQWVRRESATSEIPLPQLPISQGSSIDHRTEPLPPTDEQEGGEDGPEKEGIGNEGDESGTIATDIQQGRQLLQRLQLVQQRHDVEQVSDRPPPSQQDVLETANQSTRDGEVERGVFGIEEEDLGAEQGETNEEKGDSRFNTNNEEGGKTNQLKKEQREKSANKEAGEQAMSSSSTMPAQPSHHRVTKVETDNSDDDQSDSGVSADFSPINIPSTQIPTLSTRHPTFIEREIQQTVQGKHNLQRARGLFNLADNPDVLEIPFKTNILPKPLLNKAGPGQSTDWQFSEQKMQKEISQEFQRELVLVNQGKVPGEYSKETIRHLKETKMLFEAFQQDNTEGPTRHRKPPSSLFKGHVYPSVLERTRSLEMLSLKSRPISRTHSLRLYKATTPERSLENRRSKSPVGGLRDNTCLLPYSKQDKYLRLYRSMDSLNIDVPTSKVEIGSKMRERNKRHESLLKENPFFKLRPALALQPELAKDIWETKEREEELHRQRCTLYGETRPKSTEDEKSHTIPSLTVPDPRQQSKGKLDRIWPPPSKKDQMKSGQTQESKVHKAGGQKAPLWQRWESGLINGQPSKEKN